MTPAEALQIITDRGAEIIHVAGGFLEYEVRPDSRRPGQFVLGLVFTPDAGESEEGVPEEVATCQLWPTAPRGTT